MDSLIGGITLQTAISVEHLEYSYPGVDNTPGVAVFEDLNLQIKEGSFVAVLGGNGCGKSTLAKHFNSILLPCGGSVSVFGLNTSDPDKLIAIRRHIGMVFQNPDNQIVANVVEEDVDNSNPFMVPRSKVQELENENSEKLKADDRFTISTLDIIEEE